MKTELQIANQPVSWKWIIDRQSIHFYDHSSFQHHKNEDAQRIPRIKEVFIIEQMLNSSLSHRWGNLHRSQKGNLCGQEVGRRWNNFFRKINWNDFLKYFNIFFSFFNHYWRLALKTKQKLKRKCQISFP